MNKIAGSGRAGLVMLAFFGSLHLAGGGETDRFVQDRFAIGFWVDPPSDGQMDQHYADIAAANFTLVIGGFGASSREDVQRQIALCERHDLKALISLAGLPPEQQPDAPAVWGYKLRDEPPAQDFADLGATVKKLRQARPGKLTYINLFPNYASESQLGAPSYDDYVRLFFEAAPIDVLSMDHYPMMTPTEDGRGKYCRNLEVMQKYSLMHKVPFWNYFNTMPFGPHDDPTEAQLRWQVYTSVAYGAKGVLYFCYWTPRGHEFPKGGAIITAEGRKTRHYEQAQRINRSLKNLGPTLMQLTSKSVYRIEPNADPSPNLQQTPIKSISSGDYLVGTFQHADGREAILINNYSFAYTAWPTVEFRASLDRIREICPKTGREIDVVDDSPDTDGLQVSIDSGEGRLFVVPKN